MSSRRTTSSDATVAIPRELLDRLLSREKSDDPDQTLVLCPRCKGEGRRIEVTPRPDGSGWSAETEDACFLCGGIGCTTVEYVRIWLSAFPEDAG